MLPLVGRVISRTELAGLLCGLACSTLAVCLLFIVLDAWSA
jgi:hypothetical protein